MNTIKITLHEVVTTQKEVEVTFPFYIKDKTGLEFMIYFDDWNYIKVCPELNAIYKNKLRLQSFLENGWTPCQKYEFNEALEKVSKNIDNLYEQVLEAQVKPMVDEVQQRQDLEDAKTQEQLENYLNK